MSTLTLKPKTRGSFVRCVSGLFITKTNPQGLTQAELNILTALYTILLTKNKTVVDKDVKIELANMTNNKLQVIINYVNKLKHKNVIMQDDTLHSIFSKQEIIIQYAN